MSVLTSCPNCNAELATEGHAEDTRGRCAKCGSQFGLDQSLQGLPTENTKATVSAVLGIASILGLFLTGIPAIILGWFALKAIREKKTRGGRGPAILGIATGATFSLLCGGGAIGLAIIGFSLRPDEDPAALAETQAFLGTFELPKEVVPKYTTGFMGMRQLAFSDERRKTRILAAFYPKAVAMNESAAAGQAQSLKIGLSLQRHESYEVSGQAGPIEVLEERGTDDDGDALSLFSGVVPHPDGWIVFQIRVADPPKNPQQSKHQKKSPPYYISREEIDRIFESYRPPKR